MLCLYIYLKSSVYSYASEPEPSVCGYVMDRGVKMWLGNIDIIMFVMELAFQWYVCARVCRVYGCVGNVWEYCTYLCLPCFFFGHLATIELSRFFTLIRQEHLCNHTYVLVGFVVLCASAVRLESVIFWDSLYFCRFLCIYIYIYLWMGWYRYMNLKNTSTVS